jgi:hypothetical protein
MHTKPQSSSILSSSERTHLSTTKNSKDLGEKRRLEPRDDSLHLQVVIQGCAGGEACEKG